MQPSNDIWDEILLGPLVKVAAFRTAKEAVAVVNHSKQGVGCSVWSEKNSLVMQVVCSSAVLTSVIPAHITRMMILFEPPSKLSNYFCGPLTLFFTADEATERWYSVGELSWYQRIF